MPAPSTFSADPQLHTAIASRLEEIVTLARERGGASLESIVLGGSLARGEAFGVRDAGEVRLLSDLDLYFVVRGAAEGLSAAVADLVRADAFFAVRPDLAEVPASYFAEASAALPTHQLAHAHRILWGAPIEIEAATSGGRPRVDPEDAARLLLNRCVESFDPALAAGLPRLMHRTKEFIDAPMSWLGSVGEYTPDRWEQIERVREMGQGWTSTSLEHLESFLNHWAAILKAREHGVVDRDELASLAESAGPAPAWREWTGGFALALLEGSGIDALHVTLRDGVDAARLQRAAERWLTREPAWARLRRARRWCSIAPDGVTGWARHGRGGAGPDRILAAACLHYHGSESWRQPLEGLTTSPIDSAEALHALWWRWIQGREADG